MQFKDQMSCKCVVACTQQSPIFRGLEAAHHLIRRVGKLFYSHSRDAHWNWLFSSLNERWCINHINTMEKISKTCQWCTAMKEKENKKERDIFWFLFIFLTYERTALVYNFWTTLSVAKHKHKQNESQMQQLYHITPWIRRRKQSTTNLDVGYT